MTRATVELAKGLHLHNGPETAIDDAITMRGELAAARAQLDAANERARMYGASIDANRERLSGLINMVQIQTTDKNWNYDRYMHGFANGLMLAYDTMRGVEFVGLNAPDKWVAEYEIDNGELAAKLDAANERNRTMAADLARVAQENAAMASALSKANHTADELRYQLSLASRADEGMAMRALRAAATQAGIVAIACEFSEGSITLTEAINRAQALGDAAPVLSLTDRGAGDGYCAYDEGVE